MKSRFDTALLGAVSQMSKNIFNNVNRYSLISRLLGVNCILQKTENHFELEAESYEQEMHWHVIKLDLDCAQIPMQER